jgi:hypothetical protein
MTVTQFAIVAMGAQRNGQQKENKAADEPQEVEYANGSLMWCFVFNR